MDEDYDITKLYIRDYLSYDCACGVEDAVKAMNHIIDVSYDPVNFLLTVKSHKGMVKPEDIKQAVLKRGINWDFYYNIFNFQSSHSPFFFSQALLLKDVLPCRS